MTLKNIKDLEKVINSELTSKIEKSIIEFNELTIFQFIQERQPDLVDESRASK